jgi:exonuclease VII small subunit
MATDIDEALRRLEEMLAKAAASGDSEQVKALTKAMDMMKASLTSASERTKKYAQELELSTRTAKSERQARSALDDDIKKQTKSIKEQSRTNKEAKEELQKYIDSLKSSVGDETLKKSIESQVRGNYRAARAQEGLNAAQETMSKAASVAAKPLAAVGSAFSAYQSGSSQIGTASAVLQSGMELGGSAIEGIGKIATTAGAAIMPLGPIGLGVGAAISGLGIAAQFVGKGLSETASKVLPKFSAEVEKNIAAFQSMSSSGAMFAGGVSEMIKASGDAGLTLSQMDGVLKRNSSLMSEMGGGVSGAVQQLGRVGKVMKDSGVSDKLLKLGYTFEQQADLNAETMANMQRYAKGPIDDKVIAAETQKYAENLRIISAITGEDAKKKVASAAEAANFLAFQQKKALMGVEQQAQLDAAMATMTKQEQKNFMDRVIFNGQVVNKEGLIYESMIDGAIDKGAQQYALLQQGILTADSNAKLNQDYAARMRESVTNATDLGQAALLGIGPFGAVGVAGNDLLKQTTVYGKNARDKAKEAVEGQGNTTDDQTTAMVRMIKSNQELNVEIQTLVLSSQALEAYMNSASKAAELFKGALEEIINQFGGPSKQKLEEQRKAEEERVKAKSPSGSGVIELMKGTPAEIAKGGPTTLPPAALATRNATAEDRKAYLADKASGKISPTTQFPEWKAQQDAEKAAKAAPVAPVQPTTPAAPTATETPAATPTGPIVPITKPFPGPGNFDPIKREWTPIPQPQPATPRVDTSNLPKDAADQITKQTKQLQDKGVDLSPAGEFQARLNDIKADSSGDMKKMFEIFQLIQIALQEGNQYHRDIAANTKKTVEVMQ